MELVTGNMKRLLRERRLTIGTWITINDPDVTEALSRIGFDWFVMDMEHAPLTIRDVQRLMQPLASTGVLPLVRVAWNDPILIKLALDIGAEGVVVPWVNCREDAERAVRACRYPPKGIRGFGPRRASVYGLDKTYGKRADESISVVVQIETEQAVENAYEILSVDGVDAFFIGPYDLSQSLGIPGEFDNERFVCALEATLDSGRRANKVGGIWADDPDAAVKRIGQGFRMIGLASDMAMLLNGAARWLRSVRNSGEVC
jgi:2-dehydro-3-deoxyglucarate aldolase